MSRIIGIDLGTTNSCVAVIAAGEKPEVLADETGQRITPSIVAYTPDGEILVGVLARRQAIPNAENTIAGAKRLIGRKVNSDEVAWFAKSAPFRIVAAPNGDAWVRIGKEPKSPQEVASHVLARLRAIAEAASGEPITRAVVTVPAYFNEAQRQATRDAGAIAGLDIVRILNEPTAAALAYGAHRVKQGRRVIAVFDLGGGTFDISIMAVENGIFEVLATDGDSALGGEDWDRKLVERLADEIFDQYRIDVTTIPVALGRLKESVEQAKKELSEASMAIIRLPYLATTSSNEQIHFERELTREELELVTEDLRKRLAAPCQRAMEEAELTPRDIEEVLLVGGMSRSPAIQAVVESIFERKPSKGANPDEVVAQGAASYGGILAGTLDDAALLDVTPHDIGIKVGNSSFAVMIKRNSMLPVRARRLFATTQDDQSYVKVEVYQGTSDDISGNRRLGSITLEELPQGKAGSVRIELIMTLDVESLLSVTARERSTGKQAQVEIRPSGGLSRKELVEIITRRRKQQRAPDGTNETRSGQADA
ncbi:MAG: Hsp70 family protein [Proteobacteria bacterium]|nr:Hsp70 family protein [Pseudomonadota bacterium]